MSREQTEAPGKAGPAGRFLFISEILNRPVVSAAGETVGRLHDPKVRLNEPYPPIVGLAVRKRRLSPHPRFHAHPDQ
ncbi:MAG TPA: hypothetical protein PLL55_03770 [Candidatus Aminicenantes bacterium]|nr:hypothetical protein [Candidatus Aminicenantes bacterium]HPH43855.1 hypothetical protein [Candidatus Aminicenantes bacterium]HPN16114.1 hypothetical protein [Candidatus Aminicenantes bacterium]